MTLQGLRRRQEWDVDEFARINLPKMVQNRAELVGDPRGVRVLDMPIHMPGKGIAIPEPLMPFINVIAAAFHYESFFDPPLSEMYAYITVDQKMVQAGKTGRRPGAHADGYIATDLQQIDIVGENADVIAVERSMIDHTYIWHDCLPTEFFKVSFPLTDTSNSGSMESFDMIADACTPGQIGTYPNKSVLMMTPYVIHRCAIAPHDMYRTFIKVSVSDKQFRRMGNTHNHLFNYHWDMGLRNPETRNPRARTTPWLTG